MKIQCACGAKYAVRRHAGNAAKPGAVRLPELRTGFVGFRQRTGPARICRADTRRAAAGAPNRPALKISHAKPPPSAPAEAAAAAPAAGALRETSARTGGASLRGLRKADVPAMHEIVRPCLLAAVPGEGRGAKHQHAGLCRAIVRGRRAVLAEGRRHRRFDRRRSCRGARFLDLVCVDRLGPHVAFSIRFDDRAFAGESRLCGTNQIVFLHGGTLARCDIKSKKEIWSQELVSKQQIADLAAREYQSQPNDRISPKIPQSKIEEMVDAKFGSGIAIARFRPERLGQHAGQTHPLRLGHRQGVAGNSAGGPDGIHRPQ